MELRAAVAVVTGGASGIGAGVARMLLDAGARVVVFDRASPAGEAAPAAGGPGAGGAEADGPAVGGPVFLPVDVTEPAQVEAAVAEVRARFGRIDVLVGAAGITATSRVVRRDGTLFPLELFRRGVEVNLIGAFDVIRHAAGAMAANEPGPDGERGVIVNIASIAAYEGQVGQASYSASKGGLVALTLPLARDLASHGIRVLTICPGTIDTPMVRATSEQVQESLAQANVFPHRLGRPDDIAAVVRTCLETTYINGETIRVDAAVRLAPR